ncbi:restriction endonuclease subunit S [Iodobacter ciconiae]|uniref:Restriction endonuclease subunit S n=1 Tax=Iodobacter ciconiae TaxID=2496266 RepID=A0A3S8ZPT8_9NEIS|nr:restriction endonuclease subunit S [Iodobacter ciconiae]AZN35486.1 restriction endonuclease subunit S [Iodobacter ciconiae]
MSWPKVKLSSIAQVVTGSTPSKEDDSYFGGDIPFVTPGELDNGFVLNAKQTLTQKGANVSRLLPKNSVMVCCIGSLGKVGISGVPVVTNQQINSLILDENKADPMYVYFFCQTLKQTLVDMAPKTTVSIVNKSRFSDLEIPLPPLETQKQIAAVLEKADQLRKDCQQMEQELNKLAQAVFIDMFGDPATNPMGWPIKEIGDTFELLTDYHANGSYEVLQRNVELLNESNFALMVRTTDLEKNNFVDNVKYISEHAYNFLEKTKVYGGELLVNKIGSAGKIYLMPKLDRPVSLAMNQFMIRFKKNEAISVFIYHLLSTEFGAEEIKKRVNGAVTKTIRKDALREIALPIPPVDNQLKFCQFIDVLNVLKNNQRTISHEINEQFDALLKNAFNGELNLKAA